MVDWPGGKGLGSGSGHSSSMKKVSFRIVTNQGTDCYSGITIKGFKDLVLKA